ncbi:MAG: hypothetical protein Q4G03_06610 [Planctomycetia bacterium]|nr:hypothetical protein [Planctomycetia bacterium]
MAKTNHSNVPDCVRTSKYTMPIRYFLYQNPLYKYIRKSDKPSSDGLIPYTILVIGFAKETQEFVDIALEMAQILPFDLKIVVLDKGVWHDKTLYFDQRPELKNFVTIEGEPQNAAKQYYGHFQFVELDSDTEENCYELTSKIAETYINRYKPNYVFVGTASDERNQSSAQQFEQIRQRLMFAHRKFFVGYLVNGDDKTRYTDSEDFKALDLRFSYDEDKDFRHWLDCIENVAMNLLKSWRFEQNVAIDDLRREFEEHYQYQDMTSFALLASYCAWRVTHDVSSSQFFGDSQKTARIAKHLYEKTVQKGTPGFDESLRADILWRDHRRWSIQRLCWGWRRRTPEDTIRLGKLKDPKMGEHIALARTEKGSALEGKTPQQWKTMSPEELAELDELERISVDYHRYCNTEYEKACAFRLNFIGDFTQTIKSHIAGHTQLEEAFHDWLYAIDSIDSREDSLYARKYKQLRNEFWEMLDELPPVSQEAIKTEISDFERLFNLRRWSCAFRNWKKDISIAWDAMPLALTRPSDVTLILPFEFISPSAPENDDQIPIQTIVDNFASALSIKPDQIVIVVDLRSFPDAMDLSDCPENVCTTIEKSCVLLRKRLPQTPIYILEVIRSDSDANNSDVVDTEILKVKFRKDNICRMEVYGKFEEIMPYVIDKLCSNLSETQKLVHYSDSFDELLKPLYSKFCSYCYDSEDQSFTIQESMYDNKLNTECQSDWLYYINKPVTLLVSELQSLWLYNSYGEPLDFLQDYEDLYKFFHSNTSEMKDFAKLLKISRIKSSHYASLQDGSQMEMAEDYCWPFDREGIWDGKFWIMPTFCERVVRRILNFVYERSLMLNVWSIEKHNQNTIKVSVRASEKDIQKLDNLLWFVRNNVNPDDYVLEVTVDLDQNGYERRYRTVKWGIPKVIVNQECKVHCSAIIDYVIDNGYAIYHNKTGREFSFITRQYYELFEKAGNPLELYTYYSLKDICADIYVKNNVKVTSIPDHKGVCEFDCIATQGFRTLFVECKARDGIESQEYDKLARHASLFGVNSRAVMLVDSSNENISWNDESDYQGEMSPTQYGESLGVYTFFLNWDEDPENEKLGDKLLKFLKDTEKRMDRVQDKFNSENRE